jgi:hypothetical protein
MLAVGADAGAGLSNPSFHGHGRGRSHHRDPDFRERRPQEDVRSKVQNRKNIWWTNTGKGEMKSIVVAAAGEIETSVNRGFLGLRFWEAVSQAVRMRFKSQICMVLF